MVQQVTEVTYCSI